MVNKIKNYFLGAKKEFKAITWPTKTETRHLTTIVIALSLVFAAYLGVFDYLFSSLLKLAVKI